MEKITPPIGDCQVQRIHDTLQAVVAKYRYQTIDEACHLAMARVRVSIAQAARDGSAAKAEFELLEKEAQAIMRALSRMPPEALESFGIDAP